MNATTFWLMTLAGLTLVLLVFILARALDIWHYSRRFGKGPAQSLERSQSRDIELASRVPEPADVEAQPQGDAQSSRPVYLVRWGHVRRQAPVLRRSLNKTAPSAGYDPRENQVALPRPAQGAFSNRRNDRQQDEPSPDAEVATRSAQGFPFHGHEHSHDIEHSHDQLAVPPQAHLGGATRHMIPRKPVPRRGVVTSTQHLDPGELFTPASFQRTTEGSSTTVPRRATTISPSPGEHRVWNKATRMPLPAAEVAPRSSTSSSLQLLDRLVPLAMPASLHPGFFIHCSDEPAPEQTIPRPDQGTDTLAPLAIPAPLHPGFFIHCSDEPAPEQSIPRPDQDMDALAPWLSMPAAERDISEVPSAATSWPEHVDPQGRPRFGLRLDCSMPIHLTQPAPVDPWSQDAQQGAPVPEEVVSPVDHSVPTAFLDPERPVSPIEETAPDLSVHPDEPVLDEPVLSFFPD